jgi:hypothetical protein
MIETHERVAWAWLDKLLGQPDQREEPPPARAMTRAERERLVEQAYEATKDSLLKDLVAAIPEILREEARIAAKHGLDPLFVNWFLVNGKHWPPLSPRTREALRALQSLHIWFGAVPATWSDMIVPELEHGDARDEAMKEIGEWFLANVVGPARREYLASVWRKARDLVKVFKGPAPDADAGVLLLRDFKRRLVGDRFQEKPAVGRIVDLF